MPQLFSTGQLARLLAIPAHRIEYAHASGQLGEPGLRFLGKRAYDAADVRRVALYFGVTLDEATFRNDEQEKICDSGTSC